MPIARSASSTKAPSAFLTRTARLLRTPVPLSAGDTPPRTWGSAGPPQRHPNSVLWNTQWRFPQNLHGREGGLVQSCLVNPRPKNKNMPQTKNRPKNKNHLGLSTERAKNKDHLGHKQDKSGEH